MEAGLASPLFWGSLAFALAVAFFAAFPVNRYLIARGRGHAVVHQYHGGHHSGGHEEGHDDYEHRRQEQHHAYRQYNHEHQER